MALRLVSPVAVGRQAELVELAAAYSRAATGESSVLLVAGEAGVGKTRLVGEAAAHATSLGGLVVVGGCLELGGEGVPFAPLVEALRTLAGTLGPVELTRVLGSARRDLSRLLPELEVSGDELPPHPGDSGRLFELVLGVLGRIAERQPLVLVVEDLHWAHRSTLDLLVFLVRSLRAQPILIVATYRSDELHRRHPLRRVLAELERTRSVAHLHLERFSANEVRLQLHAIMGAQPSTALVEEVHLRSEGNAFLVEEVAELVRTGGSAALPPSLRDLLLARMDRVGPDTQRLLQIASVGGQRVGFALLEAVAGAELDATDVAIRDALENQVLVVDRVASAYAFRHALGREAVYDDILPGDRARLHRRYAQALEDGGSTATAAAAAAAAHHWDAAYDPGRALPLHIVAASGAAASFGYSEALSHLMRALELWDSVPDAAERAGAERLRALEMAVDAAILAPDYALGMSLVDEALVGVDWAAEPGRTALLRERRARLLRFSGRGDAVAELEGAVALLPDRPPSYALAVVLSALATMLLVSRDDYVRSSTYAQQAVATARAVDAAAQEADALITLGVGLAYLGDSEKGIDALREGLMIATRRADPVGTARAHVNLADVLETAGQHQQAIDVALDGSAHAERVGLARTYGVVIRCNLVEPMLRVGRWDDAAQLIADALPWEPGDGEAAAFLAALQAELALARGEFGIVELVLDAARDVCERFELGAQHLLPLWALRAEWKRGRGELVSALADVERGLSHPRAADLPRYLWPLLSTGAGVLADAADRAVLTGARGLPEADAWATRLWDLAEQVACAPAPSHAHRSLVRAELQRRQDRPGSPEHWQDVVDGWRAAGEPYPLSYGLLRLGDAHLSAGSAALAAAALAEAAAIAEQLGAAPRLSEIQRLATRGNIVLGDTGRPHVGVRTGLDLTRRELEVLQHLARGRSNGQIAAALFISTKTASVHVSNILAKLGVTSRTEAALVARDRDMLGVAARSSETE